MWTLLFWLLALALFIAPFVPALAEWWFPTDDAPLRVVREEDANIRHFAHSFFDQVQALLEREHIDVLAPPPPYAGEFRPGQPFLFVGTEPHPQWSDAQRRAQRVDTLLVALGELMLEGGYVYEQEIFCGGQLFAGARSTFRALYAGTDLLLGDDCAVARWLHSQGHASVGRNCRIFGRASSATSITLGLGSRFQRLNAPLLRFGSDAPVHPAVRPGAWTPRPWVRPEGLRELDEHTVAAAGTLRIEAGSAVRSHVVARDHLELGLRCDVTGNLKAGRTLVIGAGCVIEGALVSAGDIVIGRGCSIKGPVVAEGRIVVGAATVIGRTDLPTTVVAPDVTIAAGSQVSGSLWATEEGRVAQPKVAIDAT